MKIRCPHCEKDLPASRFYRNAARKNDAATLCKDCHKIYEATPERRVKRTWNTLKPRIRNQPSYAHVEIRMTRDDFIAWALPKYARWMACNPGMCPSLDRINPTGHYELSNLRVIERGENNRLARNHPNVHAPRGTAWCGICKAYLERSSFYASKREFNGLQKRCKPCHETALRNSAARKTPAPSV